MRISRSDSEGQQSYIAPFEWIITVRDADIDQLGHVNNVIYLKWVQDIAVAHWRSIAPEPDQNKLSWVVLRHEIDYKLPALSGDALIVRTWVGRAARLRFDRHTEFLRGRGRALIAKACTVWCPVDAQTGRPVQVSPEIRSMFSRSIDTLG